MILYDTKYLQLKSTKAKHGQDWVYAHRPNVDGVVVILPIIEDKKFLFLIEERPPLIAENITQRSIGLPAGLVGDERRNESIQDAVKAELLEEAGLIADRIEIKSNKVASSPGCVTEVITIAFAYINKYKIVSTPIDDGGVIIERVLVDIDNIHDWLKEQEGRGATITASTLAALFYYMKG
jgi:8-oxo-dGTP pyrophosphatase MutT (NUDIX family)